jgi:GH25 family lysozyme M1 (1,4-beta-N-acetylmuramidase)
MTYVHGLDWGGWDEPIDLVGFRRNVGSAFFITQVGSGTARLVPTAKNLGYITGLYWWNSALDSATWQIDTFSKAIDKYQPDLIAVDFEHYWADWRLYNEWIAGKITRDHVPLLPPNKISDNGAAVTAGLEKRWRGKYLLVYTAKWFTDDCAPMSVSWLRNYPLWVANYPDYGCVRYKLPWEQIADGSFHIKTTNGPVEQNLKDWRPTLPAGLTNRDIWQYSSRIQPPSGSPAYMGYDHNVYHGSIDSLRVKCGLQLPPVPPEPPVFPPEPPPPDPPPAEVDTVYKMTCNGVWVREEPWILGKKLTCLYPSARVTFTGEEKYGYAKLKGRPGWVWRGYWIPA